MLQRRQQGWSRKGCFSFHCDGTLVLPTQRPITTGAGKSSGMGENMALLIADTRGGGELPESCGAEDSQNYSTK